MGAFDITKETFQDVIGTLGLDSGFPVGRVHQDGVGKELVPVFVDLSDQFLSLRIERISFAGGHPGAKSADSLLDAADVGIEGVMVEPWAWGFGCDTHGLAELVENRYFLFDLTDGFPQHWFSADGLQITQELEIGTVVITVSWPSKVDEAVQLSG